MKDPQAEELAKQCEAIADTAKLITPLARRTLKMASIAIRRLDERLDALERRVSGEPPSELQGLEFRNPPPLGRR